MTHTVTFTAACKGVTVSKVVEYDVLPDDETLDSHSEFHANEHFRVTRNWYHGHPADRT